MKYRYLQRFYKTIFSEKQGLCGPLLMYLKKRLFSETEFTSTLFAKNQIAKIINPFTAKPNKKRGQKPLLKCDSQDQPASSQDLFPLPPNS